MPVTKKVDFHGKKVTVNGCEVVCKDTVLFPEVTWGRKYTRDIR